MRKKHSKPISNRAQNSTFWVLITPISHELVTDLILGSLPKSYDQFVMNYNMHNMEKSIAKLHGMLKNVETNIQKTNPVLMVQKGEGMKRKGKGKGNKAKIEK